MITFVAILNLVIASIELFIAWRIWQLRTHLIKVTKNLDRIERLARTVLASAPEIIAKGEKGSANLQASLEKSRLQLKKIQRILTFVIFSYNIWRGQTRPRKNLKRPGRFKTDVSLFAWLKYPIARARARIE